MRYGKPSQKYIDNRHCTRLRGVPQKDIWEVISKKYANEVTGVVKYYNPTDELGYIWENKEYPVLRERLKKDSIDGILYLNPDNVKKGGK